MTSLYTALCVMGPLSRALMSKLTPDHLDSKNFPFFFCRKMDVACAPDILTMNLTHTGELGFLYYIPNEFAIHVYDAIIEAGKELGLKHCGYYAQRAVRIEKFLAYWGQDLDSFTTPVECMRDYRCKLDKKIPFIGREAIEDQRKNGIKRMFVMLLLQNTGLVEEHNSDVDPWPWGGEPIYRDGEFCGTVTTASYGFSLGQQICLGFVQDLRGGINNPATYGVQEFKEFVMSGSYNVNIRGQMYPAEALLKPPKLPDKVSPKVGGIWNFIKHERFR